MSLFFSFGAAFCAILYTATTPLAKVAISNFCKGKEEFIRPGAAIGQVICNLNLSVTQFVVASDIIIGDPCPKEPFLSLAHRNRQMLISEPLVNYPLTS